MEARTDRRAVDAGSRRWVERLRTAEHPQHERAAAELHDLLLRVAYHELSRRRGGLRWIGGPEFDDLAHQAADDAVVNVLARVDEFRGLSRFTTWAYKFVVFEVSSKGCPARLAPAAAQPSRPHVGSAARRPGAPAGRSPRAARAARGAVGRDRRAHRAPARGVRGAAARPITTGCSRRRAASPTSRPDSRCSRGRALAWNREPVEGVERGDHGHAHDGEQDAEQRTDREPGEGEPEAPAERVPAPELTDPAPRRPAGVSSR
jgi:hypothetical protein